MAGTKINYMNNTGANFINSNTGANFMNSNTGVGVQQKYGERYIEGRKYYPNTRKKIITGKELTTTQEQIAQKRMQQNALEKSLAAKKVRELTRINSKVVYKVNTVDLPKKSFPMSALFTIAITVAAFLFLIYLQIVLNDYTSQASEYNTLIAQEKKEEYKNINLLQAKENLVEFEKIAVEELGMVKENLLPKKYLDIKERDKAEVVKQSEEQIMPIQNILSSINGD